MSSFRSTLIRTIVVVLFGAAFAIGAVSAHDPKDKDAKPAAMDHHGKMDNMHMMPATVDAVDRTTGMVDVTSAGMKLKLHFPPASLADVKVGDKITVHLGFTR